MTLLALPGSALAASEAALHVTYKAVVSEYANDPTAARRKYDQRRLLFKGYIVRMSAADPDDDLFTANDGSTFDILFDAAAQTSLQHQFTDRSVQAVVAVCL